MTSQKSIATTAQFFNKTLNTFYMVTKANIESFLSQPAIAVAGVSSQKNKFGNQVYQSLKSNGYQVYALNPKAVSNPEIDFKKNLDELPSEVKALLILTRPENSQQWVEQAIKKGYSHIWIQQGCHTAESLETAKNTLPGTIHGECILMHTNPKGIHAFHRFLRKLFGGMPK